MTTFVSVLSVPEIPDVDAQRAGVALAQNHVPRMWRVARSMLPSDDLASDAVQEALVCLCHQPEVPNDLQGWLVRATVHRCRHHLRTALRRLRHETLAAVDRSGAMEVDHVESLAEQDVVRAIESAIDALPSEFAAAFRLREIEGLDYRTIARRLGIPIGTVRSRIARAKRDLRTTLARTVHDIDACALCRSSGRPTSQPESATGTRATGPRSSGSS